MGGGDEESEMFNLESERTKLHMWRTLLYNTGECIY